MKYSLKKFIEIEVNYNFHKIFKTFKDVVYDPNEEKIKNVFLAYRNDNEKNYSDILWIKNQLK